MSKLLFNAIIKNDLNVIRQLIAGGEDVNLANHNGITPLMNAVALNRCSIEIVNTLISAGANVNLTDNNGTTPIMYAVKNLDNHNDNTINKVNALIAAGANVNLQNEYGNTAIFYTVKDILEEISDLDNLEFDEEGGADEDEFNYEITQSRNLLIKNFKDILKILLENGANIFIKNNKGETALDIAIKVGNQEIIDILIRAENIYKKRIAIDSYMRSRDIPYSSPTVENPLAGFYHRGDETDYIMQQVLNMAYGEENEESKSNREDAGGRRKSARSQRKKSGKKKSRSKKRKSVRKKSRSKRRKSVRKKSRSKTKNSCRK